MPPSLRPGAQGPTGELPPSLRPGAPNALDRNERLRNAANTILDLVGGPQPDQPPSLRPGVPPLGMRRDVGRTPDYSEDRERFGDAVGRVGSEVLRGMDVADQTFYDLTGIRDPLSIGQSVYDLARGETTPGFMEPIQDSPTVQNIRGSDSLREFYNRQGQAFEDAPLLQQLGRSIFSPQNLIGGGLVTRGLRGAAEAAEQTGRFGSIAGRGLRTGARVNEALDAAQARYGREAIGGLAGGISGGLQGGDAEDIGMGVGLGILGGRASRRLPGRLGQEGSPAPMGLETDDITDPTVRRILGLDDDAAESVGMRAVDQPLRQLPMFEQSAEELIARQERLDPQLERASNRAMNSLRSGPEAFEDAQRTVDNLKDEYISIDAELARRGRRPTLNERWVPEPQRSEIERMYRQSATAESTGMRQVPPDEPTIRSRRHPDALREPSRRLEDFSPRDLTRGEEVWQRQRAARQEQRELEQLMEQGQRDTDTVARYRRVMDRIADLDREARLLDEQGLADQPARSPLFDRPNDPPPAIGGETYDSGSRGRAFDFDGEEIRVGDEVTPRGMRGFDERGPRRVTAVDEQSGTVRVQGSGEAIPASNLQKRVSPDAPIPKPDGPDEIENAAQSVRTVQERADDIFRSLMPHERKNVNTQARGALRRYEGAVSHAANKTQIAVQDGTDKLKSANINPDERSEEMVELFRALHNETEPPPRLRNIYNDLKEMVAAEEARSVVGDPKFVPIDEDYFFRGWRRIEVPGDKVNTQGMGRGTFGRTQAYQRHRSDMGFSELLDTTFRDEDGYYRLEPVTWNPYKMAGIRNLMGVESREQQAILQGFREAGIVRDAPLGPPPEGWKVPNIGARAERVMVPRGVADQMESIWGPAVDLGSVGGVDVANFVNRLSTGLKRWKLFGSLFQQADFATRNGFGGFGGALEALQQGKPLRAAKNLAGVPPDIANLVIANVSPQRRRKLLREMSSNKQVIPDSDVTWADLQQGALSVEDISIMKRNFAGELKNLAREGGAKGNVEQALNRVGSIERAHQAGLFDGVYPQAIKNTMERLIMPYVERVYGDLPRAQRAAEAAKLSNEMFSTLPLTQQGLRNPYLRWTARQLIFSTNETESFLRQGSGLIKGGNQGLWRKFYLGGFLFLAAVADATNYAVTGEHLKPGQLSPIKRDRYSPFGFGYNSKFLSPVIGEFGPAGGRVNLDLMGQMDTIFGFIEDPVSFFTNRMNIIPGQIMDQVKGEDFYGRNFVEGSDLPHSIDNRVRHALTEAGFPIGLGHIMEGIRQRADLDFIAPGDRRVGETGSYIQGTGLNLRGESNRDLKNRSVREWAEENNIVGPGGQPVTSLDDIKGEPALIQQWREATPRIQEELERRGDVAIERGADYAESIEQRRTNERFKGRARQRQLRVDESLKAGEIDWGQWDQVHDDIRNDLRAQQDVIYENAQTPEEKNVLDRYYAKIEELQDPVTEEVPWEKVEAWKQTALSRSERNKLERNTGLGKKTDAEKTWANRAEYVSKSGYWDIDDEIAQRIASENPEVPDSIATRQELEEHIRGRVHDAMRSEGKDPTSPNNKPFVDEWTWNAIDRLVDPNEPNAFRKWSQNARETMRESDTQLHLVLLLTGWKTPNEEEREWLASLSEEQINEYLDQGLRLNRDSDPQSLGGIFRQAAREASETVTGN